MTCSSFTPRASEWEDPDMAEDRPSSDVDPKFISARGTVVFSGIIASWACTPHTRLKAQDEGASTWNGWIQEGSAREGLRRAPGLSALPFSALDLFDSVS